MLVLSAREGEGIIVGETTVKVLRVQDGKVQLGFEAPQSVKIWREKVHADIVAKGLKPTGDTNEA